MTSKNIAATVFLLLLAAAVPSFAEETAEEGKGVELSLGGYYRVRHTFIEDAMIADPVSGNIIHSNTSYFQHRVRLEPTIRVSENVKVIGEIDVFDDVVFGNNNAEVPALAGPPTSQGTDGSYTNDEYGLRSISPKRFYADVLLPFGKLQFGRMPSNWGLGVFNNDGNGFKNEWGDAHYGSTYDRILFATKPLGKEGPMILALGFDKTVTANAHPLSPGSVDSNLDDVQQFFLVPVYHPEDKKMTLGVFGAYRTQDSTKTDVLAASGYGDVDLDPVRIQLEAVMVNGTTEALKNALFTYNSADNLNLSGKTDVNAVNGVLRLTYSYDPLKLVVEGGYSSGQKADALVPVAPSSRRTSTLSTYPFNPDYNVGLILFEEVLARESQRATDRFPYPNDDRAALKQLLPSHGSVRNAMYVAPLLKFDLTEAFGMKLGFLYAQAIEELVDSTTRPNFKNYNGGKPSRDLGSEIDWGLHFGLADNFDFGVQLGYFMPGKAFATANGKTTNVFETLTRMTVTF